MPLVVKILHSFKSNKLDQLQTTIFLFIILLLDKRCMGAKIFLKLLMEKVIKKAFLGYSCTCDGGDALELDLNSSILFQFVMAKFHSISFSFHCTSFSLYLISLLSKSLFRLFFSVTEHDSFLIVLKKRFIEKTLIFLLNIPLGFPYTYWIQLSPFQLIGSFPSKLLNLSKITISLFIFRYVSLNAHFYKNNSF